MESFLLFVPVISTTRLNLSETIIDTLKSIGINLNYLKGQGYDGTACMSGKFNGVQQFIKNHYPQALFIHCSAHSFNLVVSSSCALPQIRNAMGTYESVYCYLNTPKRLSILKNEISSLVYDTKKEKLQQLCPTRWIQRHDSVLTFLELYPAIISSLDILYNDHDRETSSKASNLLIAI